MVKAVGLAVTLSNKGIQAALNPGTEKSDSDRLQSGLKMSLLMSRLPLDSSTGDSNIQSSSYHPFGDIESKVICDYVQSDQLHWKPEQGKDQ